MSDLLPDLFGAFGDISGLIRLGGLVGIAVIVFVETGLLVGFFLPGDALLIMAGVFAARGDLDLVALIVWTSVAACLGDATGYAIGRRAGATLYQREGWRWFRRERLEQTRLFYERHGGKTIVLARFVPLLRTFAPVVAGVAAMPYRRFAVWNVAGGILWVASMCGTGYLLGQVVPDLERRLHWMVAGVVAIALLPILAGLWRDRSGPRARRRRGRRGWGAILRRLGMARTRALRPEDA